MRVPDLTCARQRAISTIKSVRPQQLESCVLPPRLGRWRKLGGWRYGRHRRRDWRILAIACRCSRQAGRLQGLPSESKPLGFIRQNFDLQLDDVGLRFAPAVELSAELAQSLFELGQFSFAV